MLAALIDTVIILLLIGSIAYGYSVSRRVRLLMNTLKDLEPLVHEFSNAVNKSEYSVHLMRENIEAAAEETRSQDYGTRNEASSAFASRRVAPHAGQRMVHDKKDLVRQFFEAKGDAARV